MGGTSAVVVTAISTIVITLINKHYSSDIAKQVHVLVLKMDELSAQTSRHDAVIRRMSEDIDKLKLQLSEVKGALSALLGQGMKNHDTGETKAI